MALLADAYKHEPREGEIAASYAHALARTGKVALAKKVLRRVVAKGATAEQMILWRWLEQGAPDFHKLPSGPSTPPSPKPKRRARAAHRGSR